jgi:hypothetical protein
LGIKFNFIYMDQAELKKLKDMPGEARGVTMQTDANYVSRKIGEQGLVKLQQKTKELGWEIDYKDIKTMAWYPLGQRVISLLAAKEAFDWGYEEIKDMGNCAPKYSFIASTMLKYFLSVSKVFQEAAKYWEKHYSVGKLVPVQIDEEKKFAILRLEDFDVNPIFCPYFTGYFLRISQLVVKSEKITAEETECPSRGGRWHEFLMKWV